MAIMFSQRHFIAVAKVIANRLNEAKFGHGSDGSGAIELDKVAQDFDKLFKADNPKYDSAKFFKACGFDS